MLKRIGAFALTFILILTQFAPAFAATLGPVSSYKEMLEQLASARNGDTLLIRGDILAGSEPLSTEVSVHIKADDDGAAIHGLQIHNAAVSFADIRLSDLQIGGTSNVLLSSGVSVYGSDGNSALHFRGNGTLIVERGCSIQGGSEGAGIFIAHSGGDFYGSIEGTVAGGDGKTGGAGMIVSPLGDAGAMMISGSIQGGRGDSLGGHALNLYDLSGNAYITVDGTLQGGSGSIGGDGIQLVSANDNVNVGISGHVRGGAGASYGGSALILMNPADSSAFHLSGSFSGGDALNTDAQPGTSLQLVGEAAVLRARINDCILEDGRKYTSSEPSLEPAVTPLPEIPAVPDEEAMTPLPTDAPTQPPAAGNTPSPAPSDTPEPVPSDAPSAAPSLTPADPPAEDSTEAPSTPPEDSTEEMPSPPADEPADESFAGIAQQEAELKP